MVEEGPKKGPCLPSWMEMTCGKRISHANGVARRGTYYWSVLRKSKSGKDQIYANIKKKTPMNEKPLFFWQKKAKGKINEKYLLLDNQSTVKKIANTNLLKNTRRSSKPIIVHCNAGATNTNLKGELGGITVHCNPTSIENVLSLKSVAKMHRETYSSLDHGGVFKVHTSNGVVKFKPSKRGLHYMDLL
jgi:hypothetical protein